MPHQSSEFDMTPFTQAPLRMEGIIEYEGKTPWQVFETLGDPEQIPHWYLLAREVNMHPRKAGEEQTFNVVFTFFGDVYEEVLHWDPPHRYVYLAQGDDFPIRDYVSQIEVVDHGNQRGTMSWRVYCNQIDGEHFQKILPVMLPAINEASLQRLAPLIGGTSVRCRNFFDTTILTPGIK
ncbi:SRPBCC family protein [Pseudomaricurvus alkylphenolicus]|jgi:uncharacterized protein YndB with AHSA1/START domain|uniref:SRPBCC family protein n=1 Tax=Pseudomaricurvus alkylphenolicus TaxID=1306991 RepID=UPI00141FF5F0|nr:SRPBCC family protein [Pseudomaricurvus alkylphenolicus]NIB39889.1 SRPBCC family protein [Pseudomaricurvus alkylphenolicus]